MTAQRPPMPARRPDDHRVGATTAPDIAAEHHELRQRLERLVGSTELPVIIQELAALRPLLALHFAHEEEAGGIHLDVERSAPHLLPVLDRLLAEHATLLADTEAATPRPPEPASEDPQPLTEVETPGAVTIELMVEQMGLPAEATMKCILFDVEGRTVAVLVPGDREVNEEKLARLHFPERVRPFDDDQPSPAQHPPPGRKVGHARERVAVQDRQVVVSRVHAAMLRRRA